MTRIIVIKQIEDEELSYLLRALITRCKFSISEIGGRYPRARYRQHIRIIREIVLNNSSGPEIDGELPSIPKNYDHVCRAASRQRRPGGEFSFSVPFSDTTFWAVNERKEGGGGRRALNFDVQETRSR